MKKVNSKKILKKAKEQESDRERVTLYLSKRIYADFRKVCALEEVAPSKVIELFMEECSKS